MSRPMPCRMTGASRRGVDRDATLRCVNRVEPFTSSNVGHLERVRSIVLVPLNPRGRLLAPASHGHLACGATRNRFVDDGIAVVRVRKLRGDDLRAPVRIVASVGHVREHLLAGAVYHDAARYLHRTMVTDALDDRKTPLSVSDRGPIAVSAG